MAENSTRYKMNVRSPYYVVADETGKPELIANDPDVPDEYQEPATLTEGVDCGDVINIGEDVGVRIFNLDTEARTGDVTIDYNVSIPAKIQATWNGNTVHVANQDYIGNITYQSQMEAAGISTDDMTLGLGSTTGTLTINKSTAKPSTVSVQVTSVLRNDEYSLTFNCPAKAAAPQGTLPTPLGSRIAYNVPAFLVTGNPQVSMTINGVSVLTRVNAYSNSLGNNIWGFVITDNSQITPFRSMLGQGSGIAGQNFISKKDNLRNGWNTIKLTIHYNSFNPPKLQDVRYRGTLRSGLFHDGSNWRWAYQNGANFYDYIYAPQLHDGVWNHDAPTGYGQANFRQDLGYKELEYQWYEEEIGSPYKRAYFKPLLQKRVYNGSGQLIANYQDMPFTGESINVEDGDLR